MKILCTQLGRIGDMILNTGAFRVLKETHPEATIDVLSSKHNFSIIENNPNIDKFIIFYKSPLAFARMIYSLRKTRYDYYIDFKDHYSSESALLAKFIKANVKVGFNKDSKRVFDIDFTKDIKETLHFSKKALVALEKANLIQSCEQDAKPDLQISPIDEQRFSHFARLYCQDKFICVNISATAATRVMSHEKWKVIIDAAAKYLPVVIISAPTDKEKAESLIGNNVFYYPTQTVNEIFPVITECQFLISPDTSTVHIASAFSKKVFAFYQLDSYNIPRFAPMTEGSLVLTPDEPAIPLEAINNEKIVAELTIFVHSL